MTKRCHASDGRACTSNMHPCICPTCDEPLVITCANGCSNAADGATGFRHPVASMRAPKGDDTPARRRVPKAPKRRPLCHRCGKEQPKVPGRPRKVCEACETPAERTLRESRQQKVAV